MKKPTFQVHAITPKTYRKTTMWSLVFAVLIVAGAAALGRAAHNFKAALTDKPDVAIYLLLEDEELGTTTLLRQNEEDTERDYLADTKTGPKLVKMKKGDEEWYVDYTEALYDADREPDHASGAVLP